MVLKGAAVAAVFSLVSLWLITGVWTWARARRSPGDDSWFSEFGPGLWAVATAVLTVLAAPFVLWVGARVTGYPGATWVYVTSLTVLWPLAALLFGHLVDEHWVTFPRTAALATVSVVYAGLGVVAAWAGASGHRHQTAVVGGAFLAVAVYALLAILDRR
ncbi:hypothetical protein U9R90_06485 [Streptomyces sp. E11-3]|uniref:hypothetical protein n=1 Tax=Streptomyces sp. E11-3 TaxID=3110112 RepID=UPI0039804405